MLQTDKLQVVCWSQLNSHTEGTYCINFENILISQKVHEADDQYQEGLNVQLAMLVWKVFITLLLVATIHPSANENTFQRFKET